MRFGSALPRWLADRVHRRRSRGRLYSWIGLRRLLQQSGFQVEQSWWAAPEIGAGATGPSSRDAQRQWLEVMAARGWTVPDWPKDYGGGGLSPAEARVLKEEMQRIGARPPLTSFGISMLGPALLKFGTEEQKKHYLTADRARRNPLVPGLFGARRRIRPRGPANQGRGQRRPLAGQRPEGVDQLRRQGRLDLLPGAHLDRVQAGRDQLPAVRHGNARASRPSRSC